MTANDEPEVMVAEGDYNAELQLYREAAREPDKAHLDFYRWLVLHGRIGKHGNATRD